MGIQVELRDGEGKLFPLSVGSTFLGRGDFLGNQDKRLSRKQVNIEVEEDGFVYLTVLGVNPTYMTKKGADKPKMLKKDKKYQLDNGDFFTLLTNNYPYTVKIKNEQQQQQQQQQQKPQKTKQQQKPKDDKEQEEQQEQKQEQKQPPKKVAQNENNDKDNNNNSNKTAPPTNKNTNAITITKKRKIEDDSDDGWGEGSGDESIQKYHSAKLANSKFAKIVGGSSSKDKDKEREGENNDNDNDDSDDSPPKQVCSYGASCYRKNPAHWEEFSHPGDKKKKQDKNNQSQSEDELIVEPDTKDTKNSQQQQQQQQKQKPKTIVDNKPTQPVSSSLSSPSKKVNFDDLTKGSHKPPIQNLNSKNSSSPSSSSSSSSSSKSDKAPTGNWSLAFPLISTASNYGQFDVQKAVAVAAEVIKEFLEQHNNFSLRLHLIVEPENLSTITKLFAKQGISDADLNITITPIIEAGAQVIAIENSWRLKKEPRNNIIYQTAECLEQETRKRYPNPGVEGNVYTVPMPSGTSLPVFGIGWVVHCVGPNMNPNKTNCFDSYEKATPLLKQTFEALFQAVYDIACGKHDY